MIIEINIQVERNRLSIHIPQARIAAEASNFVAYELSTRKIVAVGETAESMEKRSPEGWEQAKSKIGFAPVFDVQAFDVKFASAVLWYYVGVARSGVRPSHQLASRFLDRTLCNLRFPQYDSLPSESRWEFEFLVQESLGVDTLLVNGESVGWPKWQRKCADWSLRLIYLSLAVGIGFLGYDRLVLMADIWRFLEVRVGETITTVVGIGTVLAGGAVLFYLVTLSAAVLWMMIVGKFLPKDLLETMIFYYQQKYKLKVLDRFANILLR